jgi:shikimate kinase/3-dehydroquinate synthase
MAHIFLYGPPGSGKTTIGSCLATALHMPFVDLDRAIEAKKGKRIAQLMEECGERGFRDVEAEVLRERVAGPDAVIALGGGTLLRPANRQLAEGCGNIVCLRTEPDVLLQRLAADPNPRPLLECDLERNLLALLAGRAEHYQSFPLQINANQPPASLTERLQMLVGRFHLNAMGSYDVLIENGGIERLGEMLRARGVKRPIVVTDENVSTLHSAHVSNPLKQAGYEEHVLVIPRGESYKTLETVVQLWQAFLEAGLDRGSTVIALGGGVVGDLTGFAASTFSRGIDWIYVPTTLLAMIDASIGGKTGFDLPEGKNLIGSFHAPRLVLADPNVLCTLPDAEFRAGLSEVVKHGVIADPDLFVLCAAGAAAVQMSLPEVLRRAVAVKVAVIERDPYERGERAVLNFGHTIGHAVEAASAFSVRHGEAVAMGMVAESRLAERLGIARHGLSDEISEVLTGLGLPVRIPAGLPRSALVRAMQNDKKKAGGVIRFALPADIAQMRINVEVTDLQSVLEEG